jgi:hypothetical protein
VTREHVPASEVKANLDSSDLELIRVIEDLVELLIAKGVINITELPISAREKLSLRRGLRSRISELSHLIEGKDPLDAAD